jgi:pimeloyl-ACP methyl ester carboxylesterase
MVVIVSDRRAASDLTPITQLDQPVDLIDLTTEVNSEDMLRVIRWAIAQSAGTGSFLTGKVDPSKLALGGHSLGGYYASWAAVMAQSEGPTISALVLLDPADERLGQNADQSSLTIAPEIAIPTVVLASEENTHPVQCNMDDGTDCTLVAPQEYQALTTPMRLGLKVVGSVHEDVEDPSTQTGPDTARHLQLFERYGMAWLEWWLQGDCAAAPYLNGPAAAADQVAGGIDLFADGLAAPGACG